MDNFLYNDIFLRNTNDQNNKEYFNNTDSIPSIYADKKTKFEYMPVKSIYVCYFLTIP